MIDSIRVIEQPGVALSTLTTMHVGGPARRFLTVDTTDDLVEAVRATDAASEAVLVLSGGSNLVVADEGFAGTVVAVRTRGVRVESAPSGAGVRVHVAAGEGWDDFVVRAVAEGWTGIEALSGIPGAVGATPVQNVGAYGQEVAQTIAQVRVWDRQTAAVRTLDTSECGFGYRDSRFKRSAAGRATGRYVVLEVVFELVPGKLGAAVAYADLATQLGVGLGARVPLGDVRAAVLAQRRRRGMVLDPGDHDTWSCGSFFTNPILTAEQFEALAGAVAARLGSAAGLPGWPEPAGAVKTSAAWLIERAGFGKGFGMPGPAALSTKHTLAVTNRGGASATDVLTLARTVRDGVAQAFGVRLVAEPVLVGVRL